MLEPSNKAVQFLITVGRAVDKFLTAIGISIQVCIVLAIFFAVLIFVLPVFEGLVYIGALAWLAVGFIILVCLLLYYALKRLST